MSGPYANAAWVLSPALLREVQRFWTGLLWVPSPERRRRKTRSDEARNRRIRSDRTRGLSLRALARRHHLSKERIRIILRTRPPSG